MINMFSKKTMSYPLGIDNPYKIIGIMGTTRWGLYRKDPWEKVAEFASQTQAYAARRAMIEFEQSSNK